MLFAVSGLVCWCGISQVIGNSISSSFENAFSIPPRWSTVALVAVAIVPRKNATVKVLDVVVPVMAACYFFITLLICSCTAMVMLLTPSSLTEGLEGMDLLQAAMGHHLGAFGVAFIAAVLWLFSFSTFLGVLFYARSNVACLFGDSWRSQTAYKLLALAMLFVGGLAFCRKAPPVRAPCSRGLAPSLQARACGWTKAKAGSSSGSAASSLSPRQASSVMRTALMRLAAAARQ